jgi:hypothetical protein
MGIQSIQKLIFFGLDSKFKLNFRGNIKILSQGIPLQNINKQK